MSEKPNIVFMLGDNVGWGDLSCYGGLVPTPRLDELVETEIVTRRRRRTCAGRHGVAARSARFRRVTRIGASARPGPRSCGGNNNG